MKLKEMKHTMVASEIEFINDHAKHLWEEEHKEVKSYTGKMEKQWNHEDRNTTCFVTLSDDYEGVYVEATVSAKGFYRIQFDEDDYVYGQFESE